MKTMYRVSRIGDEPTAHEVLKVTDHFVTVAKTESREAKHSEWSDWFDTEDEARMFMIERHRRAVDNARRQHDIALRGLNALLEKWKHLS